MEVDTDLLKAKLKYHRKTYKEAGAALGINRDTFARKLRTRHFTIQDIHSLMDFVPLDLQEMERIFFHSEKQDAGTSCF